MGALLRFSKKVVSDDSLSLALFGLFLLCVAGQGLTGWRAYNDSLQQQHFQEIALGAYLCTGNFLDGMFSNWQAAFLQLAVLIVFGTVLRQKGAEHSRKPGPPSHPKPHWKFGPRPTAPEWLYANSLSLAFIAMFMAAFALHLIFGSWKFNEDQALRRLPPVSLGSYAGSSSFWFTVFQCWEAEFLAIGVYIVLSIFLRQQNSPESKPVDASNEQTGGANE